MISRAELNPGGHKLTPALEEAQSRLLSAVNVVREAYKKPMTVTSGFRSWDDHLKIYLRSGAIQRTGPGPLDYKVTPGRSFPTRSKHLTGEAADFADRDGSLMRWCKANVKVLEAAGIWCEEADNVPRVHMQCVPPASGKRFFKP